LIVGSVSTWSTFHRSRFRQDFLANWSASTCPKKMEAIARLKLAHIPNRRFSKADILEVFEHESTPFDSVISTYTVHHL
jgi:hypothetical protein